MLRHICFSFALGLLVCCSTPTANATIVSDFLNASNTFQDGVVTGGVETIFQTSRAMVIDPGSEFNALATLYEVDASENAMTMTLISNAGLSTTLYGPGTFDRYYFGFDGHTVDSIAVTGGATALTNGLTVGLLPPGFDLNVADLFSTGISLPVEYENGGFFVQFGDGTDYGNGTLGESVSFSFTTTAVPEPGSAAMLGFICAAGVLRRKRKV